MSEVPETVWLRDLDETGSMHVCSKEDLGAVPYVPLDLAKPRVKPLVWDGFGLEMWADGVGGRYYVSGHNSRWAWAFEDSDPYLHGEDAPTEEAAKAAAQAHHEATILGALEDE